MNKREGAGMSETEFDTLHTFSVAILLNGQEIKMGNYCAASKEQAVEQCKKEIRYAEEFNLFATEVEA